MNEVKLSEYAKEKGMSYISAYRAYKNGIINGAYQDNRGNILIPKPDPIKEVIAMSPTKQTMNQGVMPEIKYENISLASIETRKNKSADSEIVNRFANIDSGIVPYMTNTGGTYNRSGIVVKDCIVLCQKAYFNVAIFRQIIDLIVDLSIGEILFKGGNKKSREFFKAYIKKAEIDSFQTQWFLEFWRSSNNFVLSYDTLITPEDALKITNLFGTQESAAAKKINIPFRFTILNPSDIQVESSALFLKPNYQKILNGYELARLKNPKNEIDEKIVESLPTEVKKALQDRKTSQVSISLPPENLWPSFYKKMDYEGLAIPVFFPVLDDINWKLQLKKMDIATTKMMNQAILLITTGTEPEKGGINPQNITNLQTIFLNESVGRVLVADYTTKAEFIIPDIASILSKDKYEVVNNDIYIGLNYILLQGEKFANKQTALQLFIEKIKYGRKVFLNEFLNKIIEKIAKDLNFKSYPEAYFEDIAISDTTERNRIIARMAEIGGLTPKEAFEALKNGKLPLPDESVENQRELKTYKDEGLYQPVTGGPATQIQLLKEQNKNAVKLQESQHEHDAKQKSADRKHQAENPQAPAPQIVLNAPTKLKQQTGRPAGSTRPQSTKRVKPLKASLISGSKVIENTILFDKLNKLVIDAILKKYKLKYLSSHQLSMAEELSHMIVRNEDPKDWELSIANYLENPRDKNFERIEKIEELAYFHQIEPHLASILFASLKEENQEKEKGIEDTSATVIRMVQDGDQI